MRNRIRPTLLAVVTGAIVAQVTACEPMSDDRPLTSVPGYGVRVPDPCTLIRHSLARELVAAAEGVRLPADPDQAECEWSAPSTRDLRRKAGSVGVLAIVRRVRIPVSDEYFGAKSTYRGVTLRGKCVPFASGASESCWSFTESSGTLWVAVRKGHVVLLISCGGRNIPALAERRRAATARLLAAEVLSNL